MISKLQWGYGPPPDSQGELGELFLCCQHKCFFAKQRVYYFGDWGSSEEAELLDADFSTISVGPCLFSAASTDKPSGANTGVAFTFWDGRQIAAWGSGENNIAARTSRSGTWTEELAKPYILDNADLGRSEARLVKFGQAQYLPNYSSNVWGVVFKQDGYQVLLADGKQWTRESRMAKEWVRVLDFPKI